MPTETAPRRKPKQTSWLDAIPAGDDAADFNRWQTRGDVLKDLADNGYDVTERSLMFWESRGVLPRPLVRWKDGRPHTWYPPFAAIVVGWLVKLRESGNSLERIEPILKGMIESHFRMNHSERQHPRARWNAAVSDLAARVDAMADVYAELSGRKVTEVEVRFTDDGGELFTLKRPAWFRFDQE